jgi:N-acetylneuraminic acid mutarotase
MKVRRKTMFVKSIPELGKLTITEFRRIHKCPVQRQPAGLTRWVGIAVIAIKLLAFGVARAANSGPASGGNTLTINGTALGNGSDITNVTICKVVAAIQSQTANSVTVVTGRAEDGGTGDIMVYSASLGVMTFTNGYTYNPPGAIFGLFKGWLSVSNLPVACCALAAVSVKAKIYAIGGYNRSYQSAVNVYDPSQPKMGWSSVSNLPAALYGMGTASVNGKIYSIGGYDGSSAQSTVYVYDPAQPTLGWLNVSNLPVACDGLAAASVNGKIYAIGGCDPYTSPNVYSNVYVYDVSQPTLGWLSVSNLPVTRCALAAVSVNGKIYAIGRYNGISQSTVYVYDPSQPTLGWLNVSNLPTARSGLAAASVNGKIYAIGGYDFNGNQSTVYVYDPAQPTLGWLSVGNLPVASGELAAASGNGKIYAMG